MPTNVFLSVGRTFTPAQEKFVAAVEDYLKSIGLNPLTVGRTYIKNQRPLLSIKECMGQCAGTVIIAFERIHVIQGVEKRDSPQAEKLKNTSLPTVWNQIEATMAYALGQPLLVISENGLRNEGLLEQGYDWYIKQVDLDPAALAEREFVGLVADWKTHVDEFQRQQGKLPTSAGNNRNPADLSIAQLLGALTPSQLWTLLVALATVFTGIATVAYQLGTLKQ